MPPLLTRRSAIARASILAAAPLLARPEPARPADPQAGSSPWSIGCYTRPWAEHDYRVALDAIAAAGFQHAGLMTARTPSRRVITCETSPADAAAIAAEIRSRGLRTISIYGGDDWLRPSPEESRARLKRLIDNCAACASSNLLLGGVGKPDVYDLYCETIARCCDHAASVKLGIAIKPHGGLNPDGIACRRMVERVGHPSFRVWYDPGNILFYSDGKLDPTEHAGTVDGLVSGVCIKDFRPPKDVALTPGTGTVDFAGVLARLVRGGFTRGPLVVECLAKGDPDHLLAEARKARTLVEALVSGRP